MHISGFPEPSEQQTAVKDMRNTNVIILAFNWVLMCKLQYMYTLKCVYGHFNWI